ncbi:MAG: sensor histidine kinase, partial [Chloroflexi bacterium]
LAALFTGQVLVWLAVDDYKNALIAHDAALAGALVEQGLDPVSAASVFTVPKTDAQRAAGRLALEQAGVTEDLDYRFVPEAELFLRRYGSAALIVGMIFSTVALAGLALFFVHQDRQIETGRQAVERFMQSGERAGAQREVFALSASSLDEGSLAQLFGAINSMAASLTAHLQKEQQDREFLKETISDISHQLKTPLTALQMYNEIIRDENPENPMVVDFIHKSEHELLRMEYLIQNLLKLARLDAGAIVLNNRPLALPAFLEDTLGCFATRAAVEGKQVQITCPAELMLVGDEHWLAEAVSNLVKNAFDHTGEGGLVQVICEETPLMVTITVQDNGTGIHPEDLPYVFKRFYRSRFSQDHQGIGIGLTLALRIVEKHGGSVVVESELGQGAVFRMIFPKLTKL